MRDHKTSRRWPASIEFCGIVALWVIVLNISYGVGYRNGRNDALDAVVRTAPALIANVMDRAGRAVEAERQRRNREGAPDGRAS